MWRVVEGGRAKDFLGVAGRNGTSADSDVHGSEMLGEWSGKASRRE